MKKLIFLVLITLLLTGCSLSSNLEKICTKTTKGIISNVTTYNIKFKKNKIYEIIKTVEYTSENSNKLKTLLDSIEIESKNKTTDFVTYNLNGNILTTTYDVINLDTEFDDIKEEYSKQKEYLEELGYICK